VETLRRGSKTKHRISFTIGGDTDDRTPENAVPIDLLYEGGNHYLAMRPKQ